ncbi:helix-turn-helix transcriptional regulator [Buttiauxella noackiae]|uniref:helix-turn-helix transcriptional regulator n=1 Tax=Buttiauxella noackiae TaxID=82992 RepID=UPI0035A571AF
MPKITTREKNVLIYTLNGIDINIMSHLLKISHKTIYQHQRNALKKFGIRKPRDIINLPTNFIDYICHP